MNRKLGLIAGSGKFPFAFAQRAKKLGYDVVAGGVQGDTSFFLRFFVSSYQSFHVGELQKLLTYFQKNGVQDVLMAGQVDPNHLFDANVKFDKEFEKIRLALINRKADTIFTAVADKLEKEGLKLIDSTFLIKDLLAPKGTLTHHAPSQSQLQDIAFGCEIARQMGAIDVGQTVVIKGKAIVAIEAMEGTNQTILRGGKIARLDAVVVKMSKPNQDFRFDVPVVGPNTIRSMIKSKCSCLAVEADKTILIDRDRLIKLANQHQISIVSVV